MTVTSDVSETTGPAVGPPPLGVLLAVVVTVVAWASAFVVIRYAARDFSPGALSLGRLLVGSAALSVGMIVRRWAGPRGAAGSSPVKGGFVRPSRRDWGLVALIGVVWFGVYNVALNAGERHVDAGTASMLIQLAPILVGLGAGLVLGEGFPRMLVIGGLVAFAGTLVIGIATSTGDADVIGVLLVLLAALVYSVAMLAQKVVLRRLPGLQVTWLACLVGTLACLPYAGRLIAEARTAPALSVAAVVYLGLVPTAIAFSTWAYALSQTSAGRLGITTFAVPPVAILLGWLLLGEVPALLAIVGGVVSLVGVAISRRPSRSTG